MKARRSPSIHGNLVQKVLDLLTAEILSDKLRPNQKIIEIDVAKRLGISRSPVREALRILERDGLVTRSPNRGVVVMDISPEEADELYLIHGYLMRVAVKLACQKIHVEALKEMEGLVRALKLAAKRDERLRFLELRANLERFIAEQCLSSRLAHLLEVMGYPSARYRAFHVTVPGYMKEVARCYSEIYEAFCKKDDAKAERLRVQIIELGRRLLRQYFIEPYTIGVKEQIR